MLYSIAIPIFNSSNSGTVYESNAISNTIKHNITAIITYIVISWFDKSLVSKIVADIPLILHCLSVISRKFSIVFNVSSDDIASLKVASIIVLPSLYTLSFISSCIISCGILVPITSVIPTTFSTLSNCFILFSNFCMSFDFILSTTITENEPISNSSFSMFSPWIVSMFSGRYTNMS